jgi:hypothetical protein
MSSDRHTDLQSVFTESSTEERVYQVLVGLREPKSAPAVGEQADCSADTARKYLNWFADLGIARKHEGTPVTFERNEEYFEWQSVTRIADTHTHSDLKSTIADLRKRRESLRERYGAESPRAVDTEELLETTGIDIETLWDDLSTWAGLDEEIRLHDRARRRLIDRNEAHV